MTPKLRFNDKGGKDYPDWEESNLGELCSITTGKLDANAQVTDGRYLFFTCAKEVFRIDEYAFEGASLLISGNGANVGYIHNYEGRFNAYQRTYVLQNIKVNRDYLQYYLEQNLQRRIHREKKDGNTPYIVMTTLTNMGISLPSAEEQNKIALVLKSVDQKINLLTKKKEALETYKKGLMQKIFSQELRFKREDGTDYPEWETLRIEDISEERSERGFEDYPLLSITLHNGIVPQELGGKSDSSSSDKSNYKLVKVGDIGYNSMRMWQGASGVSSFEGIVSPAYTVFKLSERADAEYIGFLFKTHRLISTFKSHSQGLTSDTWNLKYPTLKRIKIKLPSIDEQLRVVRILSHIDVSIESLNKRIDATKQLKKGLLQQMFV